MSRSFDILHALAQDNGSKIAMYVMDGVGGLPNESGGRTELEAARTPHLDALVSEGVTGLHIPVARGITPGSGAGHLGLFGYDPLTYSIGRGALAAAGIDFDWRPGDVAVRGNFCTVDGDGLVTDRRAGRIGTDENRRLVEKLRQIRLNGAEVRLETIKEHRFLLVLRGADLSDDVEDTDPQQHGVASLEPRAERPEAERTVELVRQFLEGARGILGDEPSANMVLLRGFASKPDWPTFRHVYGLRAAASAAYPMYRGIARLLGMEGLPSEGGLGDRLGALRDRWDAFDFFFVHVKPTDSRGEDGDFDAKVRAIEEADAALPALRDLGPDVIVATGDHSTPSRLQAHSWHPVPVVLWSRTVRPDTASSFGETACRAGGLGPAFPATDLMPLALAHALRLKKYGA